MELIKSSITAFIATLFCIWLLRPLAYQIGLVDRPGGRKTHEDDIPLIGGISMFFGFCFSLLILPVSLAAYRGLIAASGLLVLMGVVDDFKGLSSRLRLLGQLLAGMLLIVLSNQVVDNMGNLFFLGDVHLGLFAFPVTLFSIVGYINAMNMIDGQDGLAGGVALSQIILFLYLSTQLPHNFDAGLLINIAVLLIVFLGFNMQFSGKKRASIFMGDAGSTFIALVLAYFAISFSQINTTLIKPMVSLWILAFPLFDLIAVLIYRVKRGLSPLQPGRDHFHHVLHIAGLNANVSTFLLSALSFMLGAAGIALNFLGVAEGWQAIAFMCALSAYLWLVRVVRNS